MTTPGGPAAERVLAVIERELLVSVPTVATDMISAGLLDSLAMVSLVVGLEDEFGVRIPVDDFDPDDFRSVEAILVHLHRLGVTTRS